VLDRKGSGRVWKWIVWVTAVTFVVLTLYAMFRYAPEVESVTEVAERASELRVRTLGFLAPFWLLVVTLTWILISRIRLHDRVTASEMSAHRGKA
jgi:uncharacterized membrane protein YhaH (DUF805 family)